MKAKSVSARLRQECGFTNLGVNVCPRDHSGTLPTCPMHVKPLTTDSPLQHSPTTTLTVQHLRNSPMRDCMGDVACDETGAVAAVAACVDGRLVRCYSKSTANPAGILQNLRENRKKIL